ncbi:MAG: ribosome maturation factor RimP [marine benthic group bacterium]|jgi:ribosome maturation factor RimP|nr:ribosome maturation factor RimP [Gemmatimonadota bacterium]MCL7962823.1 ribosome maturation factor RimP [Candidatus Carthagonibacter metallireducens]MCL7938566.1 ribosome maturation factor RimP [Gemmatimonadota bacterium]MCL7958178.1 ribosome maturation factor RimP [Gemmatimonadota bacterium]MCL7965265.1 ribosome maturation factor RimP [Gemmatimonadota bacterium]
MGEAAKPGTLERAIETVIEPMGFELVSLERGGGRRRPLLRLRVDRQDGVPGRSGLTVEDCASVSRAVEERLDETGEAGDSYILEVSSPGVERPLTRHRDFERCIGLDIRLRGFAPLDQGRKQLEGNLLRIEGDNESDRVIVLRMDEREVRVPLKDVAKAQLVYRPEDDL